MIVVSGGEMLSEAHKLDLWLSWRRLDLIPYTSGVTSGELGDERNDSHCVLLWE